jgi:hypothetical protein
MSGSRAPNLTISSLFSTEDDYEYSICIQIPREYHTINCKITQSGGSRSLDIGIVTTEEK